VFGSMLGNARVTASRHDFLFGGEVPLNVAANVMKENVCRFFAVTEVCLSQGTGKPEYVFMLGVEIVMTNTVLRFPGFWHVQDTTAGRIDVTSV
jgi:hypothetical protein